MNTARKHSQRGGSMMEFVLITLLMIPMTLGVGALGYNMILVQETAQLAREAGYMYGRGTDFTQPGNQTMLATIGSNVGMTTSSTTSKAVVILTAMTYVDAETCAAANLVDVNGNPSGCTNYNKWVFAQRLSIGNPSVRSSNVGSPVSSGPTGVTIDSSGNINIVDYCTKAGAVASFTLTNPYSTTMGTVSGLPSRQFLYMAEAASSTFSLGSYQGMTAYAYGLF